MANLRPRAKGQSGNPAGRPKSPVDIAALAREHGPKCIEVAAALLDDPDPRIRLSALTALLDRGFGKPATTIVTPDAPTALTMLHLVAAKAFSAELPAEQQAAQPGNAPPARIDGNRPAIDAPIDLMQPL